MVPEEDIARVKEQGNGVPEKDVDPVEIDGVIVEPIVVDEKPKDDKEAAGFYVKKALSIKNEIEGKFWEMGEVLSEIFNNQYYVDCGYRHWQSFCNELLDIKWRTADYLRSIFTKFSAIGVAREEVIGIGWARLKELLPVVDKENAAQWLSVAKDKENSMAMINNKVKVALGKMTPEEAEKVPEVVAFRLYSEQKENVMRALELASRLTNSDSRPYQLEMICVEFRSTYEADIESLSKAKVVRDLLGKIEGIMKVEFKGEVIDIATGEIIS